MAETPFNEQSASFSPDGGRIAFVRGKGDLVVVSANGGDEVVLDRNFYPPDFRWSPDGEWIAFASEDQNANSEIFIVPVDGGEAYNLSRHPDYDISPVWSPDGRRLVWSSHRHDNSHDVWAVWLSKADDERTHGEWLRIWTAEDEEETARKDDEDSKEDIAVDLPQVTIDFDQLWRRPTLLTSLDGDEVPVAVGPRTT